MGFFSDNVNFEELLNSTLKEIKVGQVVTGTIININDKSEVFIDIGYKADGIIPKNELFSENEDKVNEKFKIGDKISAEVLKLNDGTGNVLLSYKKVQNKVSKKEFDDKVKNNFIFKEKIVQVNNNGLIVNAEGIRVFIPMSLSGINKNENINEYLGKEIRFKVIENDEKNRKIVGSVKQLVEEEKRSKVDKFWNDLEIDKLYVATVTSLSEYGAFVDIDGVQGLLHISEMTWERNKTPKDILKLGQEIKVKIKEFDKENRRVKLIYDKKGPDPWEKVNQKYSVNDIITVKIVKFAPFGVFVELEKGIEGLVHISQISDRKISKPEDVLEIGQKVNAKIFDIDEKNRKIELSIKELIGTSNEL